MGASQYVAVEDYLILAEPFVMENILQKTWEAIRANHPDVPDLRVYCGRTQPGDAPDVESGANWDDQFVKLYPAAFQQGQDQVLDALLREAAHDLHKARTGAWPEGDDLMSAAAELGLDANAKGGPDIKDRYAEWLRQIGEQLHWEMAEATAGKDITIRHCWACMHEAAHATA